MYLQNMFVGWEDKRRERRKEVGKGEEARGKVGEGKGGIMEEGRVRSG